MAMLLPGHYATERFAVEELAEHLQSRWGDVDVLASRRESDPVRWM
jgi:putative NIF3 family GTP cyclohydrolase 1 type 2